MNIASFLHLNRTLPPISGVGRHIVNMTTCLTRIPGANVYGIAPREELDEQAGIPKSSLLHGLPVKPIPMSRKYLEISCRLLNRPKVDEWADDADWIYCPSDAYIATRKSKLAVTIHDIRAMEPDLPWSHTFAHQNMRWRWKLMLWRIVKYADVILSVSEFTKQRLVMLMNADPNKIIVVGNGVEASFFDIAHQQTIPLQDRRNILIVGGLTLSKGGDYVIQVAKSLLKQQSKLKIVVVGGYEPNLEEKARQVGNIDLIGRVNDPQLIELLKNAIALLYLSRYEGFGIPPLEAMAAGVPAVISNCASLPEIIGNAGLMFNPKCHEDISTALIELSTHEKLRNELINKGRIHAAQFTWDKCAAKAYNAMKFL